MLKIGLLSFKSETKVMGVQFRKELHPIEDCFVRFFAPLTGSIEVLLRELKPMNVCLVLIIRCLRGMSKYE